MSFPRYPRYKESGVEWLGEVPEHWAVNRLGSIFRQVNESGEDHLAILCVSIHDGVSDKELGEEEMDRKVTRSDDRSKYKKVKPGDLVYNMMRAWQGGFGAVAVQGMVSPAYVVARPTSAFSTPFVEHLLRTPQAIEQMRRYSQGVTDFRLRLYWEEFKTLSIVLPPSDEQVAITEFLEQETAKIDELVAEQQRLIELLKEKRQAVISHAVTKGLNPHAPMKPSGIEWLGDVPAHWSLLALKRAAEIRTGVAKGKDNSSRTTITVPYLRVANVQDGYLDLGGVAMIDIPSSDLERYALKPGDVLMNEGGDFDKLGRGCVWDGQIEPCITQNHVFAVRPRAISSAWLNVITSSDYAQFYFMTRSKQSTNLASISSTNLMELPVIVPPEDEQANLLSFIADQTARCDALTAEAQRAIHLLQERRTTLISAAVTGQIDVRQFAENEIAA